MPIKDSAKKYMKVTAKKTIANRKVRGAYRSAIKSFNKALTDGDMKKVDTLLASAQKALDKAVQKNVIKKNTAARTKSRMNKKVVAAKQK
jgi:small subunit ribosomal protein S20